LGECFHGVKYRIGVEVRVEVGEVWIPAGAGYLIYGYPLGIMKQYENKYQVYA
jgi:hypothetical protein